MKDFEILVLKSTGEVILVKDAGFQWTDAERDTNVFAIVNYTGTELDASVLSNGLYDYHFDTQDYWNRLSGLKFKHELVVTPLDAPEPQGKSIEIAEQLNPNWQEKTTDVCAFFVPEFQEVPTNGDYTDIRRYWYNKFAQFETEIGTEEYSTFLAAILYRDFGDIFLVCQQWTVERRQNFINSEIFSAQDKEWLRFFWNMN